MTQVIEKIAQAEQRCLQNGVRLTAKRRRVLTILVSSEKALSAYEIVDHIKQEYGEVMPAMSVYRILDFLQQNHLAHKLSLANRFVACCHFDCDHQHEMSHFLICKVCQRVEEVSMGQATQAELNQDIEKAGFQLAGHHLEINCICGKCINAP